MCVCVCVCVCVCALIVYLRACNISPIIKIKPMYVAKYQYKCTFISFCVCLLKSLKIPLKPPTKRTKNDFIYKYFPCVIATFMRYS